MVEQDPTGDMSPYDQAQWRQLDAHWSRRQNRRGAPDWLHDAGRRTLETASSAGRAVADVMPERAKEVAGRAGQVAVDATLRPAASSIVAILRLADEWAMELNDPRTVVKLANKRGVPVEDYRELAERSLEECDRVLARHTLTWRSVGALEGGAMGALALVPIAGLPTSIAADTVVIQILSVSIASQVAYAYGYDAKAPDERGFIESLVSRSFLAQAAKAKPATEAALAAQAAAGRVRWSEKLRADHEVIAGLEKLMAKWYPKGTVVPVQHVAKALPLISIAFGAGANSQILAQVSKDAQRVCQTRFLCDTYGLPLPVALKRFSDPDDDEPEG